MNSEIQFCPIMNINNYYIILAVEDHSETWRLSGHNSCCSCRTLWHSTPSAF